MSNDSRAGSLRMSLPSLVLTPHLLFMGYEPEADTDETVFDLFGVADPDDDDVSGDGADNGAADGPTEQSAPNEQNEPPAQSDGGEATDMPVDGDLEQTETGSADANGSINSSARHAGRCRPMIVFN